jgi:hypothetical protein
MSSTSLTIQGGNNVQAGIVSVPTSSLWGDPTATGTLNYTLQQYLDNLSTSIVGGSIGFENNDILLANGDYTPDSSTPSKVEEITNTDTVGNVSPGLASGSYTVSSIASTLAVQAPGTETITGSSTTGVAIFGAQSSVNYTVTDPSAGSIFAAGSGDVINLLSNAVPNPSNPSKTIGVPNAETVYAAAQDTVGLYGQGTDFVSLSGSSTVRLNIQDANANVTATGSVATTVFWSGPAAGGTLNFINNSSGAATIYVPVFATTVNGTAETLSAVNHVTAYGGAGGGIFVGGQGGNNSLVGGTGAVNLTGGGNNDFLEANSSSQNFLTAGSGSETLFATSTTGGNTFGAGLNYVGIGQPASNGVISTDGSGVQNIFLGNSNGETIYGSTQTGATNQYIIVGDSTAGGGIFDIYNFTGNSTINLVNGNQSGGSDASIVGIQADQFAPANTLIGLSDGTRIELVGVSASSLTTSPGANGIVAIH